MLTNRIALATGANQGMGKQVAKELVSDGVTVFVGSRDHAGMSPDSTTVHRRPAVITP